MIDSMETRELVSLGSLGVVIPATHHRVRETAGDVRSHLARQQVGVLFLNSLSPSRAAAGDSAVYWADSIARIGYPAFRVDLPGFGDSFAEPPEGLLGFFNKGGYASVSSAVAKEIVERFDLSGVVVVGLCAGAVSAIYTASLTKECKGLLLMDPYFHLPLKSGSKFWERLKGRSSRTAVGAGVGRLYERTRSVWKMVAGSAPPSNANFSLLNCWKEVSATGLPTILFRAPGFRQRGEFDYLDHVLKLAGRKSNVTVKTIEGANHTFSNRAGRDAVRQHIENWLRNQFPQNGLKETVMGISSAVVQDDHKSYSKSRGPVESPRMHSVGCALEGG